MLTINQKMSNSGSIYDIASDMYARTFKSTAYTVVLPNYYGDVSTSHRTQSGAIKSYKRFVKMGYQGVCILDNSGNSYEVMQDYWESRLVLN